MKNDFNATSAAGNLYVFSPLSANDDDMIIFDKPVKRIKNAGGGLGLADSDATVIASLSSGDVIEFPNDYGYPDTLYINNSTESQVAVSFIVLEYGDDLNEDYFLEKIEPEPKPEPES